MWMKNTYVLPWRSSTTKARSSTSPTCSRTTSSPHCAAHRALRPGNGAGLVRAAGREARGRGSAPRPGGAARVDPGRNRPEGALRFLRVPEEEVLSRFGTRQRGNGEPPVLDRHPRCSQRRLRDRHRAEKRRPRKSPQQQIDAEKDRSRCEEEAGRCNKQANEKKLKGDDRKKFVSTCAKPPAKKAEREEERRRQGQAEEVTCFSTKKNTARPPFSDFIVTARRLLRHHAIEHRASDSMVLKRKSCPPSAPRGPLFRAHCHDAERLLLVRPDDEPDVEPHNRAEPCPRDRVVALLQQSDAPSCPA